MYVALLFSVHFLCSAAEVIFGWGKFDILQLLPFFKYRSKSEMK